jgi:heme exporter protein B
VTVVTISLATYNQTIDKSLAAALLWIAILFAAILSLPRTFIAEEEHGTADLLRLMARPHAVFWGKALFNVVQAWITGAILSFLFFGFTHAPMKVPWLYLVCLISGCASVAGGVTLCGAFVARAANRYALAGAIAVPLLLPLVTLGVTGVRVAIGPFETDLVLLGGERAAFGLIAYAIITLVIGPPLYAAVWKS